MNQPYVTYDTEDEGVSINEKIGIMALIAVVLIAIVMLLVWWFMTKNAAASNPASIPRTPTTPIPSTPSLPSVTEGVTTVDVSKPKHQCESSSDSSSDSTNISKSKSSSTSSDKSSDTSGDKSSSNSSTASKSTSSDKSSSDTTTITYKDSSSSESSTDSSSSEDTTSLNESSPMLSKTRRRMLSTVISEKGNNTLSAIADISTHTSSRHSKTRSETGEIEVYTLGGKRQSSIIVPSSCSVNCMVSDNRTKTLYVHLKGNNKQTGIYKLSGDDLALIVLTKSIEVQNMYMSNDKLVVCSDVQNYTMSNNCKLVNRKGSTYDKHELGDDLITLISNQNTSYNVNIGSVEVATLNFPTRVRFYNSKPVYFTKQTGHVQGIKNVSKVTSFDSNGSILAYVKDCVLNIITQDTYKTANEEVNCEGSITTILNNKIYIA